MKFTDSQIFFINDSIRKELNEQEIKDMDLILPNDQKKQKKKK